jgi:hypothetical protein
MSPMTILAKRFPTLKKKKKKKNPIIWIKIGAAILFWTDEIAKLTFYLNRPIKK